MKIYIVKVLINDEYGDYDNDKAFASKEKAQDYVNQIKAKEGKDFFEDVWFDDEPIATYIIEEMEVIE